MVPDFCEGMYPLRPSWTSIAEEGEFVSREDLQRRFNMRAQETMMLRSFREASIPDVTKVIREEPLFLPGMRVKRHRAAKQIFEIVAIGFTKYLDAPETPSGEIVAFKLREISSGEEIVDHYPRGQFKHLYVGAE